MIDSLHLLQFLLTKVIMCCPLGIIIKFKKKGSKRNYCNCYKAMFVLPRVFSKINFFNVDFEINLHVVVFPFLGRMECILE